MAGPRVISIMNQKGGVGKTTTTLNLGAALARRGRRVLVVDLDPQANLTLGLGRRAADLSESVYELLTAPRPDAARLVMKTQWERLDLLPSHIDLSGAEIEMITMIGRESKLVKALEAIRGNYDYILIDCLPSLSLLTVNAMAASTEVFVPLQAHPFALEGLGKLFEVVGMIREAMNPALRVAGVLVTMFDGRTNVARTTLDILRGDERLREHIFTTTVRQNVRVAESQKEGMPVIYFDAGCHAAKAYLALCEEVLEMEGGVLASHCAQRIMQREEQNGAAPRTFSPDLLAPPAKNASDNEALPETPRQHAAPVSALMAGNPGSAENPLPPAVEDAAAQDDSENAPAPVPLPMPVPPAAAAEGKHTSADAQTSGAAGQGGHPPAVAAVVLPLPGAELPEQQQMAPHAYPRNDPGAETLHPSAGTRYKISEGGDPAARAQAAQSGVNALRFQISENYGSDERPRLRTSR